MLITANVAIPSAPTARPASARTAVKEESAAPVDRYDPIGELAKIQNEYDDKLSKYPKRGAMIGAAVGLAYYGGMQIAPTTTAVLGGAAALLAAVSALGESESPALVGGPGAMLGMIATSAVQASHGGLWGVGAAALSGAIVGGGVGVMGANAW